MNTALSPFTFGITGTFLILICLGLSQKVRSGVGQPLISFTTAWIALLSCVVAILGLGLLQSHLECPSLWGDCYTANYPIWVMSWKPMILTSPIIWSVFAVAQSLTNIVVYVRYKH